MPGHVRHRGGDRYELRVYVGLDPINPGKQRWATKTIHATSRRAAEHQLPAFTADALAGEIRTADTTFGAVLDEWIDTKATAWSPATLKEHRRIAASYLDRLRAMPVHQLRTLDLDRFYRELAAGGGRDGAKLDPATVRRIHVVVRASLEQARKWGLINRNPAADVEPWIADEAEAIPPSVGELAALVRAAEDISTEFALFLIVAAVTGARRGALTALRWTDLDLERGSVRFPRVLSLGPDGVVERTASKKKRSARHAALDPLTAIVLSDHHDAMAKRAAALGTTLAPDAFVFTSDPEGIVPWRPDYPTRWFAWARQAAEVPVTIRLHDLRSFMATFLLGAGVDSKTTASRGGWSQPSTMYQRYAHVLEPVDRHAAGLIGDAVHRAS